MNRMTKNRRLRKGFAFYSGWLPTQNPIGHKFAEQVEMYREDIEKAAEEAKPPGRPRNTKNPA